MARIRIKYFITRQRKDGTSRHYWSPNKKLRAAGWKVTPLSRDRQTAISEAEVINMQVDEWRAGLLKEPTTHLPGTINHIITEYKNAREYTDDIKASTRKDYDNYLRIISDWAGDTPAIQIKSGDVNTLYESFYKTTPTKAVYLIRVLSLLFAFAERRDLIPKNTNPATKMRISAKSVKQTIWQPDDITLMVKTCDDMGYFSMGTAILLNEWMGQRAGDIVTMTMQSYRDGIIHVTQSKTGAQVELPVDIVDKLRGRIEAQIKQNHARPTPGMNLIQQHNGKPFTSDWFAHLFGKIRAEAIKSVIDDDKARFKKITFQTLRHTAVTRLGEAGCQTPEIASITGHSFKSCETILDRYNVRTTKMARNAFDKRLEDERK